MASQRDLYWANLDQMHRSSISYQFARYALGLNYKLLPQDVVHQAKRCLLDALGCAIGAYEGPGRTICEGVAQDLGGPEEATVFGSGLRTSASNATLVNCYLVRFLDYNDLGGGAHNSDSIPSILAISEREKASGQNFLTSLVISYELGQRVRESIRGPRMQAKRGDIGWVYDIRGGLNTPPALGRLMGLNEDQIANAIGICTGYSLPLGIFNSDHEEFSMAKSLRFGLVAYNAVLACMLAKRGFTGPVRIVEGHFGFREVICQGEMDLGNLTDFTGWRILKTRHKYLSTSASLIGPILAILAIVKEHDLKPADITAVRIKAPSSGTLHTISSTKKYPKNGESADHSVFYLTAIAIKERAIGPQSYEPEKFNDPAVLDLIEKVTLEYTPGMAEVVDSTQTRVASSSDQGMIEITTKDGHQFQKLIERPHGLGDDPLTDAELEDKFEEMASKYMNEGRIREIFNTVWNVENLDDINKLTRLMTFRPRQH